MKRNKSVVLPEWVAEEIEKIQSDKEEVGLKIYFKKGGVRNCHKEQTLFPPRD